MPITESLGEIRWFKGWDSIEQLHEGIRVWAEHASPGDVFTTQVSAIVCSAVKTLRDLDECPECDEDHLNYGEVDFEEDHPLTQEISCGACGRRWKEIFAVVARHELASRE